MTCALGQARPWTGPRAKAQAPFLITLLAGAEFKFWDSCAQNKTSETSKNALSGCMALLCAEQNVGNLKNALSRILGLRCRTTRRKSQTNAHSGFLELLCAEQHVRHLKKCTVINSGTTVRRTERRKSQNLHFMNYRTPERRTTRQKS